MLMLRHDHSLLKGGKGVVSDLKKLEIIIMINLKKNRLKDLNERKKSFKVAN